MRFPQQIKPRSGDRCGCPTLRLIRECRQRAQKILSPLRGLTAGCQRWSVGWRPTATTCRRSAADARAYPTRAKGPIDNSLGHRPRKSSQIKSYRGRWPHPDGIPKVDSDRRKCRIPAAIAAIECSRGRQATETGCYNKSSRVAATECLSHSAFDPRMLAAIAAIECSRGRQPTESDCQKEIKPRSGDRCACPTTRLTRECRKKSCRRYAT